MSKQIIIDHQTRGSYPLKADVLAGFKEAVTNNQVTLAMEYLVYVIEELANRDSAVESTLVEELRAKVLSLEEEVEALKAALAPARKVTKKVVEPNE